MPAEFYSFQPFDSLVFSLCSEPFLFPAGPAAGLRSFWAQHTTERCRSWRRRWDVLQIPTRRRRWWERPTWRVCQWCARMYIYIYNYFFRKKPDQEGLIRFNKLIRLKRYAAESSLRINRLGSVCMDSHHHQVGVFWILCQTILCAPGWAW